MYNKYIDRVGTVISAEAVSYTHLDVYKRQVKLTVTNADGTNATVYASVTVTVKAYPVQ